MIIKRISLLILRMCRAFLGDKVKTFKSLIVIRERKTEGFTAKTIEMGAMLKCFSMEVVW